MKKIIMMLLLSTAILLPNLGHSAPIYLDCSVASSKESKKFSVKLDENSGKITHTRENGSAFNAEGFFAANTITYQNINISSGLKFIFKYEINRTDLSVNEAFIIESANPAYAIPPESTSMNGVCHLVEVNNRKI